MRKLTITFLTIVFCLTSSIAWSETVKPDDLVNRNGITYKKHSNIPFTGYEDGRYRKGTYKDGKESRYKNLNTH